MMVEGKVVVVTGAANGIGKALAERFAAAGAAHVTCADLDGDGAKATAEAVGGSGHRCDVGRESDIVALCDAVEAAHSRIDIFASNAGVVLLDDDLKNAASASDEKWDASWRINVMAHVWAARRCLPGMIERGEGWFLQTVSAAGLLMQVGSSSYSATKHAALSFAESLAVTHKDDGIGVTALCPQAVDTRMARAGNFAGADVDGVVTPEDVAAQGVQAIEEGRFLVLPHPTVAQYAANKASNHDRWVGGMAKMRRHVFGRLAESPAAGGDRE